MMNRELTFVSSHFVIDLALFHNPCGRFNINSYKLELPFWLTRFLSAAEKIILNSGAVSSRSDSYV